MSYGVAEGDYEISNAFHSCVAVCLLMIFQKYEDGAESNPKRRQERGRERAVNSERVGIHILPLKERRLILCATRLTEPRHFSNVGRGTFRSKIYLPVITPWQRRFPGCVTPGNVRVRARVSLSSTFFLCTLRASLRERGRVRIIMALRVLTLHLLSRFVIHVSPHVPSRVGSYFFPPRIRPPVPRIFCIVIHARYLQQERAQGRIFARIPSKS